MFHGGQDLRGGQHELLGDLVVRDHHHLHPSRQPCRHAIGGVLKDEAGGGLWRVGEPGEAELERWGGGWGDTWRHTM